MEISNTKVEAYSTYLKEPYRPPSKGGNTKALHQHVLFIDGKSYSFLYNGSQKWAHKSDTVSFEYKQNGDYLNIIPETFRAFDKSGNEVIRGTRGVTKKRRTASTRMPASRREING